MAGASELDSLPPPDLVIDALLGTGVHTPLSPLLTKIVATMNSLGAPVLAVDLPSGLNADTGCAMGRWCVPLEPSPSSASSKACLPAMVWMGWANSTAIP
nr:NAD(P)H-hydrate epimerase [Aeromonas salmonicida]